MISAALRVPAAMHASETSYSGTPSAITARPPSPMATATRPAWRIMSSSCAFLIMRIRAMTGVASRASAMPCPDRRCSETTAGMSPRSTASVLPPARLPSTLSSGSRHSFPTPSE